MLALLYLSLYLFCGLAVVRFLLPRQSVLTRIWLGASLGLLMMMWLPALLAFAVRFSVTAHLLALLPLAGLTLGAYFLRDKRPVKGWDQAESTLLSQMVMVVLPLTLLSAWLQYTHCVRVAPDGSWWGGQSTYGDLAMHMSFVTSLKNAAFPPEYALFPGQQLSYPFLMDSLSTSFYLMGWSLQAALAVPGTLMMALCYMGVMCLARQMTAGKKTAILAALLFFLNGGLGFVYDFDLAGGVESVWQDGEWQDVPSVWARVKNILEGYYMTPTNQPTPNNLRWSNVIADMMVPQRTLLGGWCMVIPCFYLLWTTFGTMAAGRAGKVPTVDLAADSSEETPSVSLAADSSLGETPSVSLAADSSLGETPSVSLAADSSLGEGALGRMPLRPLILLGVWGGALPLIHTHSFTALALCSVGLLVYDMICSRERGRRFGWYALYGAIACVLSVPQLFGFTFNQVFQESAPDQQHSFMQLWFNWVNSTDGSFSGMIDGYGWFYLKNIGLPFLILILALFEKEPRWRRLFAGALPIILAGEMIRFQPNIYDNNKLLYLAWLLCAMIVADWCGKMWQRLKGLRARPVIAALAAVTFFLSAGLTLWREAVSNYQLFSADAVAVGEYVRDHTEEDATFLTGANHHLNPVASIGGRKIVCGPDLWLYYHGLNTSERKAEIAAFYADPDGQQQVLEKYGVDYIVVGSYERHDYNVSYEALDRLYPRVYESPEAVIWRVGPAETGA